MPFLIITEAGRGALAARKKILAFFSPYANSAPSHREGVSLRANATKGPTPIGSGQRPQAGEIQT